jgi:putative ABC transport system ATP-binding protein
MLEIRRISKTFNPGTLNEVRSLRGVDISIEEGSWVVVIGTNGSGKSTLLNAIAGTFFVDAGSIHLADRDVTRWPEHQRAKLIGRVFQNPFSGTAPTMSIAENLAIATRRGQRRGLGWTLRANVISEFADGVARLNLGLEDRLYNIIGSLSGGQRQALTLLMATWLKPQLLLLDEHTAALGSQKRRSGYSIKRGNHPARPPDNFDGATFDATSDESRRSFDHDVSWPDHS